MANDTQAGRTERPLEAKVGVVRMVTLLESDLPKLVCFGPLSPRTTYTLRVEGPWSEVEARNLRAILDLHIECMSADPNDQVQP